MSGEGMTRVGDPARAWLGLGRLVALLLGGVLLLGVPGVGAQGEARVHLEAPGKVGLEDGAVEASAVVSDAKNLGAFEIELTYDPAILEAQEVERGPFLGSSGRTVSCIEPRLERGFLRFVCVTLGPAPPGADGTGVLATFHFAVRGEGPSRIDFGRLALADPEGSLLSMTSEGTTVTVEAGNGGGGSGWRLWGAFVAGGGAVAALLAFGWRRLRRPA